MMLIIVDNQLINLLSTFVSTLLFHEKMVFMAEFTNCPHMPWFTMAIQLHVFCLLQGEMYLRLVC
jgi:hypothetical protein